MKFISEKKISILTTFKPFFDEARRTGVGILLAAGLAGMVGVAEASLVEQADGSGNVDVEYNNFDQDFNIFVSLFNNDTGTEYESGVVTVFDSVIDSLYHTARNQSLYATKEAFIAGENINVTLDREGNTSILDGAQLPRAIFRKSTWRMVLDTNNGWQGPLP